MQKEIAQLFVQLGIRFDLVPLLPSYRQRIHPGTVGSLFTTRHFFLTLRRYRSELASFATTLHHQMCLLMSSGSFCVRSSPQQILRT